MEQVQWGYVGNRIVACGGDHQKKKKRSAVLESKLAARTIRATRERASRII